MIGKLSMAAASVLLFACAAYADPIEGNWKTASGATAAIADCGGAICITLKSGQHAGKQIGKMNANGANKYSGEITDPVDDKTYAGKATLSGSSLTMKGCVFGGLICKGQTWNRL
jgi:uncharacterized protein (DUF2147 family)